MIRKPVLLAMASSLLFCSGCAAKNRWFSRKDYAEMQDPFMDSEALAADESGKRSGSADPDEGRASLSLPTVSPEGGTAAQPGRAILQTAATSNPGPAGSGTLDKNVIKSYQGPALSDFLGKKAAAPSGGVAAEPLPAGVASAAAATARPSGVAMPSTSPRTLSPAARAAALPDLTNEVEGFNQFLQEGTTAAGTKAVQMTTAAKESVEQPVADFASWANQEQQRWNTAAGNVNAAASSAADASASAVKTLKKASKTAAATVVEEADFGSPDFEEMATAEPLLKRSTAAAKSFEPDFSEVEKVAADLEENPFDVEFDEPQPRPATRQQTPPKTARKSLDSAFQMNSGWKPANLETP